MKLKPLVAILILSVLVFSMQAQSPQRLNYQAVVRNSRGTPTLYQHW